MLTLTPRQLGFRMPAEWEPHQATWAAWPFDDEEWRGYLEGARREYAHFLQRLSQFEPICLLVHDEFVEKDARQRLHGCDVTYYRLPLDDVWFRDNGPIFVRRPDGQVALTRWRFNAWGEKFDCTLDARASAAVAEFLGVSSFVAEAVLEGGSIETNGAGLALTTRQCLLHPRRNPGLGPHELEGLLSEYLGLDRLIWLEHGLQGDHTDGHIDTLARFVSPDTVVCCVAEDPQDPNHPVLEDNRSRLQAAGLNVVDVPIPRERRQIAGGRLPLSYVNFYISNGLVLVPTYGDPNDEVALGILQSLFPGRSLEGCEASDIITSGGAFHCLTQQQPAGPLWRGP